MGMLLKIRQRPFSHRERYLSLVQEVTSQTARSMTWPAKISWPDVFWFLTPTILCKAALIEAGIVSKQGMVPLRYLTSEEDAR